MSSVDHSWNTEDLKNEICTEPGARIEGKNNQRISQLLLTSLS